MPAKYAIRISPTESRYEPVPKLINIELEHCLGCLECAKRECIYDVYAKRSFLSVQLIDTAGSMCKNCMRCVQECKNAIIAKSINPDYLQLGNDYWTPEIIGSLLKQSENGKIPVSGGGYNGPFTGPGFDAIWTDMSAIVRPTRDGIQGREYISTSVDIGRKLDFLKFHNSELESILPAHLSIPMPVILELPKRADNWSPVINATLATTHETGLLMVSSDPTLPPENLIFRTAPGSTPKLTTTY